MPTDQVILEVDHLTKVFKREIRPRPAGEIPDATSDGLLAVQDLSFTVSEGEFLVLLGPSGCGKTTILRLIAGLERPTSGKIFLGGKEVTQPGRERGMVFQAYSSFPWLTVIDNVKFGLKYRPDISNDQWDDFARHFLTLVGLVGFEHYYVAQLSGGMQQRVAIARTLAADPTILLMDEPFGALDTQTRELLQLQLLQTRAEARKTIVFVTHDVDEAIFLADKILILTARPAKLKTELTIGIDQSRTLETKMSSEFIKLKGKVLSSTRQEAEKAEASLMSLRHSMGKRNEHMFSQRRHKPKG